jgi:hypothetical protein
LEDTKVIENWISVLKRWILVTEGGVHVWGVSLDTGLACVRGWAQWYERR